MLSDQAAPKRVLVLATGGTIFQRAVPKEQGPGAVMQLGVAPAEFFAAHAHCWPGAVCEVRDLQVRSGAELSWATVFRVRDAVAEALQQDGGEAYGGFLLVTGTDTMEEFSFALSLLLDPALARAGKALAVTGAMLPSDQLGYDGVANVAAALTVVTDPGARQRLGAVVTVMNNDIHLGSYVFKGDSQLIGAFCSHPGPLGQLRGGRAVLYYSPPPLLPALAAFQTLHAEGLRDRVPIVALSVQPCLPEALLEAGLDGLVLAGSGTGSVPQALVDLLSPKWTGRFPIVFVSRCTTGANFDDYYYKGSREKYLERGFIVGGEYEHLNAVQARTLLIFRLTALGHA